METDATSMTPDATRTLRPPPVRVLPSDVMCDACMKRFRHVASRRVPVNVTSSNRLKKARVARQPMPLRRPADVTCIDVVLDVSDVLTFWIPDVVAVPPA